MQLVILLLTLACALGAESGQLFRDDGEFLGLEKVNSRQVTIGVIAAGLTLCKLYWKRIVGLFR